MQLVSVPHASLYLPQEIRKKFAPDVEAAAAGAYSGWTKSFNGLAALIIMDQFTR